MTISPYCATIGALKIREIISTCREIKQVIYLLLIMCISFI